MIITIKDEEINVLERVTLEDMQIVKDFLIEEGGEELTNDLLQLQLLTYLFKYGYYLGHDHASKNCRI